MERSSYENLRVYQMAEQLADSIWDIVSGWDGLARRTVGAQFVRAADSVGANIAEGAGRGPGRDQQRFVRIARGSLNETRFWLRRAERRRLIEQLEAIRLHELVDVLSPSLNAYLAALRKRAYPTRPKRVGEPLRAYHTPVAFYEVAPRPPNERT